MTLMSPICHLTSDVTLSTRSTALNYALPGMLYIYYVRGENVIRLTVRVFLLTYKLQHTKWPLFGVAFGGAARRRSPRRTPRSSTLAPHLSVGYTHHRFMITRRLQLYNGRSVQRRLPAFGTRALQGSYGGRTPRKRARARSACTVCEKPQITALVRCVSRASALARVCQCISRQWPLPRAPERAGGAINPP